MWQNEQNRLGKQPNKFVSGKKLSPKKYQVFQSKEISMTQLIHPANHAKLISSLGNVRVMPVKDLYSLCVIQTAS